MIDPQLQVGAALFISCFSYEREDRTRAEGPLMEPLYFPFDVCEVVKRSRAAKPLRIQIGMNVEISMERIPHLTRHFVTLEANQWIRKACAGSAVTRPIANPGLPKTRPNKRIQKHTKSYKRIQKPLPFTSCIRVVPQKCRGRGEQLRILRLTQNYARELEGVMV